MAALAGLGAASLAVVLLGCTAADPCADLPVDDGTCPDLTFSGELYDEWGLVELPAVTEELGDAAFPSCNDEEPCNGPDLDGYAATDVWLLEGVDPQHAVIGYRQGTETAVIFLRQEVEAADVPGLAAHSAD
jgi:hypothetical protein